MISTDSWPSLPTPTPSPSRSPTRASRTQGITNETHHTHFIRSYPTSSPPITFKLGQAVIVSEDAPVRQRWLDAPHYLSKKERERRAKLKRKRSKGKGKAQEEEEEEGGWRHEDGLKGGEKVGIIIGLFEDVKGHMMAKLKWFARPGAVWSDEGPEEGDEVESVRPLLSFRFSFAVENERTHHSSPGMGTQYELYYATDSQYLHDSSTSLHLKSSLAASRTPMCTDSIPLKYLLAPTSISSSPIPSSSSSTTSTRTSYPTSFFVRKLYDAKPLTGGEFLGDIDWEEVYERGLNDGVWDVAGVGESDVEEEVIVPVKRVKKVQVKKEERKKGKKTKKVEVDSGDESDETVEDTNDVDHRSGASSSSSDDEEEGDATDSSSSDNSDVGSDIDDAPTSRPGKRRTASSSKGKSKRVKRASTKGRGRGRVQNIKSARTNTALKKKQKNSERLRAFRKNVDLSIGLPAPFSATPAFAKLPLWDKAKALLHVSATPDCLPRRDEQRKMIYETLGPAIIDRTGTCLYIHGVPGTGKTATVHSVVRALQQSKDVPNFQFVEINGMKIAEPTTAFTVLWEALSGQKSPPRHALSALEEHFQTPDPTRRTTVVLVDELDQMITKKQEVIYNFFNWPHVPHSRLIVIAIANTMDLPERELSHKIQSRLGKSNRFPFATYSWQDLEAILKARLEGIKVMEDLALLRVAKMVAGVSGDARRALDIARRTVEKVDQRNEQLGKYDEDADLCSMADVLETYKEMTNYGSNLFLKRASMHQQLFLLSLCRVISRAGVPEVELHQVFSHYYESLNRSATSDIVSQSELFDIVADLHNLRLIATESQRQDVFQRVRCLVEESDLKAIMKEDKNMKRYVE